MSWIDTEDEATWCGLVFSAGRGDETLQGVVGDSSLASKADTGQAACIGPSSDGRKMHAKQARDFADSIRRLFGKLGAI